MTLHTHRRSVIVPSSSARSSDRRTTTNHSTQGQLAFEDIPDTSGSLGAVELYSPDTRRSSCWDKRFRRREAITIAVSLDSLHLSAELCKNGLVADDFRDSPK